MDRYAHHPRVRDRLPGFARRRRSSHLTDAVETPILLCSIPVARGWPIGISPFLWRFVHADENGQADQEYGDRRGGTLRCRLGRRDRAGAQPRSAESPQAWFFHAYYASYAKCASAGTYYVEDGDVLDWSCDWDSPSWALYLKY